MTIPDGVHGRLGDQRGLLHKSIIGRAIGGAVKGFVTGGPLGAVGGVTGALTARRPRTTAVTLTPRRTLSRTETARVTQFSLDAKEAGKKMKFPDFTIQQGIDFGLGIIAPGGNGACDPPLVRNPDTGNCIFPGSPRGAAVFGGQPTMGKYGVGTVAGSMIIDRAVCGKKMQLGDDGVCYNKSQISNKQRMWPAGRKPLLTGGDMRAISTAARAGRRMDLATSRLQKLGMMKRPRTGGATKAEVEKIRHQALLEAHAGSKH